MMEEKRRKKIDKYLDGDMSSAEIAEFEDMLKSDEELMEALKLEKDMRAAYSENQWFETSSKSDSEEIQQLATFFESDEADKLKNTIKTVIEDSNGTGTNRRFLYLGTAAAIAAIIAIVLVYLPTQFSTKDLYDEYMSFNDIPTLISRGDSVSSMVQGQLAFENGDYQQAITHFENGLNDSTEIDAIAYIYLGIAHLELDHYQLALVEFDKLKKSTSLEAVRADWCKAMVYLKKGDTPRLSKILNQITSNKRNYKFKEAQKLLKEIQ